MKQLRRFGVFFLLLVLCLTVLAASALADSNLGVSGPCYPVLSPTGSNGAVAVCWWDAADVTTAAVQYSVTQGFATNPGAEIFSVAAALSKTDSNSGYSAFSATMTNLSPGAIYYYRVGHEGAWSEETPFTTPPGSSDQTAFIYLGDIQYASYETAAEDYQRWGDLMARAGQKFPDLDFALLGGDMVQSGINAANWQMFLAQATRSFDSLPMLAVPGNHESNSTTGKPQLFLDLLAMPTNGPDGFKEEFYSYDYAGCHILCLSSNIFSNEQVQKGSMTEADFGRISDWIASDLAASNATWKIVVIHHPAYPVVKDDVATAVLANWEPLFVEAQVDLVLCGHQHIYMRTKPLRGVTYVMGNSGSKFYAPVDVAYSQVMIADTSTYQYVTADGSSLHLTTYNAAGGALDTVTLYPKDRSIPWKEPVAGDVDGDGALSNVDLRLLLTAIQSCAAYNSVMDLNGDNAVDICDAHKLALLIAAQ